MWGRWGGGEPRGSGPRAREAGWKEQGFLHKAKGSRWAEGTEQGEGVPAPGSAPGSPLQLPLRFGGCRGRAGPPLGAGRRVSGAGAAGSAWPPALRARLSPPASHLRRPPPQLGTGFSDEELEDHFHSLQVGSAVRPRLLSLHPLGGGGALGGGQRAVELAWEPLVSRFESQLGRPTGWVMGPPPPSPLLPPLMGDESRGGRYRRGARVGPERIPAWLGKPLVM